MPDAQMLWCKYTEHPQGCHLPAKVKTQACDNYMSRLLFTSICTYNWVHAQSFVDIWWCKIVILIYCSWWRGSNAKYMSKLSVLCM